MTKISIAMTSYNASRYIGEQLQSFVAQTRLPDELVITDDGSTDATPEIVENFARAAPFEVRYVRNPVNLGVNANFGLAVSLATGDLVFISDHDDVWFPEKLATVEAAFEINPQVLVFVNDQVIAEANGRLTDRTVLGNVRKLGYADEHYGTGACTTIRRSLLDVLLPIPTAGIPYDHWTNHLPYVLGVRQLIETPLQMYRRHDSNVTSSLLADEEASLVKLVKSSSEDARPSYRTKIAELDIESERLIARSAELDAIGLGDAGRHGLVTLAEKRRDYEARIHTLDQGRLVRPLAIAQQLAKGRYRNFQGWRSAAKDLLA